MPSRVVLPFEDPHQRLASAISNGLIRRLTCQEIAAQYPPDTVEALLLAARRNQSAPLQWDTWDKAALRASLVRSEGDEED